MNIRTFYPTQAYYKVLFASNVESLYLLFWQIETPHNKYADVLAVNTLPDDPINTTWEQTVSKQNTLNTTAPETAISTLSGKLGQLRGVSMKTTYSKK